MDPLNYYCTRYHELCNIQKCGKCPSLDDEGQCDASMSEDQYWEEIDIKEMSK